jgi:hypothetical protein
MRLARLTRTTVVLWPDAGACALFAPPPWEDTDSGRGLRDRTRIKPRLCRISRGPELPRSVRHGGRSIAVAGVRHQPNVFNFGAAGGGVWKTTDGGLTGKSCPTRTSRRAQSARRHRGVGSERGLRRNGGVAHPRQPLARRRRLQVDRRRQVLEERGALRLTADRARARAPEEPGPRLRGRARPRVGTQCRARDLPLRGRRQELEEDPLRRRQDGRLRSHDGPQQPRTLYAGFWQIVRRPVGPGVGRIGAASGSRPTAATRGRS